MLLWYARSVRVAVVSFFVLAKKSDLCIILYPCVFLHFSGIWGPTAQRDRTGGHVYGFTGGEKEPG